MRVVVVNAVAGALDVAISDALAVDVSIEAEGNRCSVLGSVPVGTGAVDIGDVGVAITTV